MPPKPDSRAADAMNAFLQDALQRRRTWRAVGAPADPADPPPANTPPRVPSIDAGVTPSATPEPDMNAWLRDAVDRRS